MTYALSAWYPQQIGLQGQLYRVDRRAAHAVSNDYTRGKGADLVSQLGWATMDETAEAQRVVQFTQYVKGSRRAPDDAIVPMKGRAVGMSTQATVSAAKRHTQYKVVNSDTHSCWECPLATDAKLYNAMPSRFTDISNPKSLLINYLLYIRSDNLLTYV